MISSVDLANYGVSRVKDWVSVDCDTNFVISKSVIAQEFQDRCKINSLSLHLTLSTPKYSSLLYARIRTNHLTDEIKQISRYYLELGYLDNQLLYHTTKQY